MSQTTSNFSNESFERMVKRIRKAMPTLAGLLLIAVYAASASIAAVLLKERMTGVSGGLALAMSIVIQATRATLVFFPPPYPNRASKRRRQRRKEAPLSRTCRKPSGRPSTSCGNRSNKRHLQP